MRLLDRSRGYKPLDFGAGGITGSINEDGRLIALNTYHRQHGYITLSAVPPFPEDQRYHQTAVRAYRRSFVTDRGYGLQFAQPIVRREVSLIADAILHIKLIFEDGSTAEVTTFVPLSAPVGVIQIWKYQGKAQFTGKIWLQRCAYTQLTEGGPVPMPPHKTTLIAGVGLQNQAMGTAVAMNIAGGVEQSDGSIAYAVPCESMALCFAFGADREEAAAKLAQLDNAQSLLDETAATYEKQWRGIPDDLILRRGLLYAAMCCVPTGDDATCILTDHMLLPLAWNRDAYYVALALLKWNHADAVRGHLNWMFEKAERIDGYFWGRSHLANGRIKDRGFQLDQQIFPMLELADYVLATGDDATLHRLKGHIAPLIDALMARKAPHAALFPTDETPGDDPIAYPYHFSSHLLFWYTLKRLGQIGIDYHSLQDEIAEAITRYFVADFNGQLLYAYASDGHSKHHFYHDANDLPLALAVAWGYCRSDDPLWRATVHFALSPDNKGGYYHGRLGSVHTPAAWPLGEIQTWIMGDSQQAQQNLEQAAQWDGALPEAYDAETGAVVSRHWFAWTNAAYACREAFSAVQQS